MDFRSTAKQATASSFIMENREKVTTEDIIFSHPDGVTIIGFDLLKGDKGEYACCVCEEEQEHYFNAGSMMTSVCKAWLDGFGSDSTKDCSIELMKQGGVKVKFTKTRTRNGNNFTNVEVL